MQFTRRSIFEIDAIDAIAIVDVGKISSPFLNNRRAPTGVFILVLLHAFAWGTRRINLNPEHHNGATLVRWFEGLEARARCSALSVSNLSKFYVRCLPRAGKVTCGSCRAEADFR